ncbi:MAG TPA: DUF1499 domain-containing protein [Burkholderiales bacterium]|nr:DUF1499 domain-containing protein [Burkholderiales bacterium]
MIKRTLWSALSLVVLVVAFGFYRTFQAPDDLWIITQKFPACPHRPSCVSSVAQDEVHKVEPLRYTGDAAAARQKLEQVIRQMQLARIEHATSEYLHVVFQTPTMHFHDDVELLVQAGGLIQVRSISRFGYGDRGVNRARVEAIRQAFTRKSA